MHCECSLGPLPVPQQIPHLPFASQPNIEGQGMEEMGQLVQEWKMPSEYPVRLQGLD